MIVTITKMLCPEIGGGDSCVLESLSSLKARHFLLGERIRDRSNSSLQISDLKTNKNEKKFCIVQKLLELQSNS